MAGDVVTLRIEAMAHGGAGVGHPVSGEGPTWLVPGALRGEVVDAAAEHRARRHVRGRLVSVVSPADIRVQQPCPYADRCGGCAWQHVQPQGQARLKVEIAGGQLRRVVAPDRIRLGFAGEALGYRRRTRMHYARASERFELGFLQVRSRSRVDVQRCLVLHPALDAAVARLRTVAAVLPPEGEVLGLTDGVHVVLGLPGVRPEPQTLHALEGLLDDVLVGVELRAHRRVARVGTTELELDGGGGLVPMRASAFVFTQPQAKGNAALVRHTMLAAAPDGRRVLELFAGAGNFTRALAKTAQRVWASDTDREAVELLRKTAKLHGLPINAKRQNAERLLPKLAAADVQYDVVVLDPPRAGLGQEATRALCKVARERFVYVSCDPATLARDLAVAVEHGFDVRDVTVFDSMPMTPEIEVVATLVRRGGTR